jgi:hypothetical protein
MVQGERGYSPVKMASLAPVRTEEKGGGSSTVLTAVVIAFMAWLAFFCYRQLL